MGNQLEKKEFAYNLYGVVSDYRNPYAGDEGTTKRIVRWMIRFGIWEQQHNYDMQEHHYFYEFGRAEFTQFGRTPDQEGGSGSYGLHPYVLPGVFIAPNSLADIDNRVWFGEARLGDVTIDGNSYLSMFGVDFLSKVWSYREKMDLYSSKHSALYGGAQSWKMDTLSGWLYAMHNLGARAVTEVNGRGWGKLVNSAQWDKNNILNWIYDTDTMRQHAYTKHQELSEVNA